jgi:hypothetical protein
MMAEDNPETDRIEADIARTRARMDDRLDQLQDHLSPKQMLNDAIAYVRGGDGSAMTSDLFARARANPMPFALIGMGIAWLMTSNASGGPAPSMIKHGNTNGSPADKKTLPNTASANSKDTRSMAHFARQALSSLASNPIALGAIAAVVGAIAGAVIPTFEQEENALGAAATKIREKGRELAQGAVDAGSRVASDTLEAVKEAAGERGLNADKPIGKVTADLKSGNLVEDAKSVAQEALQAGKDSARHHLASDGAGGQGVAES